MIHNTGHGHVRKQPEFLRRIWQSTGVEPLDPDINYRVLQTRDPRFDGRLLVDVISTEIYCRPICPARTPKRENCRFFSGSAAAQAAGFRACLRCGPEIAPELPSWRSTSNTASRALALIADGFLDREDGTVAALATRGELATMAGPCGTTSLDRRSIALLPLRSVTMSHQLHLLMETLPTPIGTLLILSDAEGRLRAVDWVDFEPRMRRLLARHYGPDGVLLTPAMEVSPPASALATYFEGNLHVLDSLLTATAGTPFQTRVWNALREIPVGRTVSYAELARRIGHPSAVRAVGFANGANPISIVVPCHRVVGVDGSLTGYGGGLARKRWLLNHETEARAGAEDSVASALALPW